MRAGEPESRSGKQEARSGTLEAGSCSLEAEMYSYILVALENSAADRAVLEHIEPLAKLHGSKLLLVHVADGWAARAFDDLELRESDEMRADRAYLAERCADLEARGFRCAARLALGDPATEL